MCDTYKPLFNPVWNKYIAAVFLVGEFDLYWLQHTVDASLIRSIYHGEETTTTTKPNLTNHVVVIASDNSSMDACRSSYSNINATFRFCIHNNNNAKIRSKKSYSYDYIISSKGMHLIQSATEYTSHIQYQFYSTICNTEASTWNNVNNSSLGSNCT